MTCYGHGAGRHLLGNLAYAHLKSIHLVLRNQSYCFSKTVQPTELYANDDGEIGENGCPETEAHCRQVRIMEESVGKGHLRK